MMEQLSIGPALQAYVNTHCGTELHILAGAWCHGIDFLTCVTYTMHPNMQKTHMYHMARGFHTAYVSLCSHTARLRRLVDETD